MRFHLILIWCFIYSVSGSHKHHVNVITLQNSTNGSYEPTWDSLDKRPLPVWYDKAKVGIFIHWGVYSVPSYGSEWFWTNWRQSRKADYVKYMTKNYKPGFTYQEFAPQFTAEFFDASEWVDIFRSSGAKYVVLTSKHHDGYALWPSKYSYSWNSMDVGPHRDIVGELSTAIRLDGSMTFGLYHSLFEWFHPAYLADKSSHYRENNFVSTKVIPEMIELIEKYEPEVLWSDGDWEASDSYWNSTHFLAWLYNSSPVRETIVANDRWGKNTACKHGGFYTCTDRYNPGVLVKHKWENAMTLDKLSWGHRTNAKLSDYMTSEELITQIVSTVSCNGNILINVGPTKEGIIQQIFQERLRDMGDWLRVNGEAIYESIPWIAQKDSTSKDVWYTYRHFEDGKSAVYATVLKYPFETSGVMLGSLAKVANGNETVQILGLDDALETYVSWEGVYVKFPDKNKLDSRGLKFAWTLKITGLEM